ncbi:MAG: CooT family nickel-binding protein [Desulfobacterales bacterium]|nr:CooT family nickel-binding protein [Desulfobacterales bacterium]
MCLASAYIKENDKNELILENITHLENIEQRIFLTNIFKETQEMDAVIKSIDFEKGSVFLEKRR